MYNVCIHFIYIYIYIYKIQYTHLIKELLIRKYTYISKNSYLSNSIVILILF